MNYRFHEFEDIDIYVTLDNWRPLKYLPSSYPNWMRVCDIEGGVHPVSVITMEHKTINEIHAESNGIARLMNLYPADHLPLFYNFDFKECGYYIEFGRIDGGNEDLCEGMRV